MIAAAVWAWFTPENPEQAGTTPDNVPMSQDQREAYRAESETYISTYTICDFDFCRGMDDLYYK